MLLTENERGGSGAHPPHPLHPAATTRTRAVTDGSYAPTSRSVAATTTTMAMASRTASHSTLMESSPSFRVVAVSSSRRIV